MCLTLLQLWQTDQVLMLGSWKLQVRGGGFAIDKLGSNVSPM